MCARREPDQVYQPIADLDAEMPEAIRDLVYGEVYDRNNNGAWVGAHAFYGLLEGI